MNKVSDSIRPHIDTYYRQATEPVSPYHFVAQQCASIRSAPRGLRHRQAIRAASACRPHCISHGGTIPDAEVVEALLTSLPEGAAGPDEGRKAVMKALDLEPNDDIDPYAQILECELAQAREQIEVARELLAEKDEQIRLMRQALGVREDEQLEVFGDALAIRDLDGEIAVLFES